MNAYELAKQLEERHAPYEDDAANMLRQQADQIAELKEENERLYKAMERAFEGLETMIEFSKALSKEKSK